jgi:citrate lyase beta subunit
MAIDPVALGATLYLPATRYDLAAILLARRYPDLRSAVICLEDSIRDDEVMLALARLGHLAGQLDGHADRPLLFVRPRDADMLGQILAIPGIEHINGFVIPKATADRLPAFLAALAYDHHLLMPTLETREVFDPFELRRLREQLRAIQERVLAIRIGGNDLIQTLGARRSSVRTVYDGPLGGVISGLVAAFAPWGFSLSAPVFENFGDQALLREEVERDLEHGLLTKTAIHPSQIGVIQGAYAVDADDLADARTLLSSESPAVFASNRTMNEPATHRAWADTIVRRASTFGIRRDGVTTPLIA